MRNGQWVETDQGVGIVVHQDGGAWVHLTNDDGTTLAQLPLDRCSGLRIARRDSIPASRVGHLTAEQLAAMGYV
jgi:hypothetical protein